MPTGVETGEVRPESRTHAFELACRKLVRETCTGHSIANLHIADDSALLRAAGRLCAIQLLTGGAGYSLLPDATDDRDFPSVEQIPGDDRRVLRGVLDTRLFAAPSGDPGEGRASPVHRHIAEFMAARYLASLIDDGLPVGRILSLITGHDGVIVSELQGLSAWLAAQSRVGRAELTARDPLGTVLHGDVREFSTERNDGAADSALEALRSDVAAGSVSDPDGDLPGTLPSEPYPARLSVSEREDISPGEENLPSRHGDDRRERRREWRERVTPHLPALRENRCQPSLLHHLAKVFFGEFVDVEGDTPVDRLRNLFGEDEHLVQTVLEGLRSSVRRNDLPGDTEIIRLATEDRLHFLALPFMAGLELTDRSGSVDGFPIDGEQMQLGLAIYFVDPTFRSTDRNPGWLPSLLEARPDVVADVLIRCARPLMPHGRDLQRYFFNLARSPGHVEVARLASMPLLQAFPIRCRQSQLEALSFLLQAALLHGDAASFLQLLGRKLTHRSMNVSQRVYWLAAGLLAAPDSYREALGSFVVGSERRIRHLAGFIGNHAFPARLFEQLDPSALQLLIRLMGTSYRPSIRPPPGNVYRIDHGMQVSDHVAELIDRLGTHLSQAASDAIEALSSDDALQPWHAHLDHAAYRQNALRREACFQHHDMEQVLEVLANRRPANAADLAALTTAHLREIARRIRDGNTSDWRQYWNVDSYNRPLGSKPEDACRDALLSDLQARVTGLQIDAQPEGRYADDKRSDIRVYHGGFNVPVEIKKSNHRDLWSAIRSRLIARYTRDPGAAGYGIYLVFWFGTETCQPPESGSTPRNPAELEERLRDTLSADEARLTSICVVDVSPPEPRVPP